MENTVTEMHDMVNELKNKSGILEDLIKKLNDFYNFLTIFFGLSLALIIFLLYKSRNLSNVN